MFNLLPDTDKKNILREYGTRRTIILLGFVSVLGIIAAISLLPSYLISKAEVVETENEISLIKESPVFQEAEQFSAELSNAKTKITILNEAQEKIEFTEIIQKIVSHRGQAVRISAFQLRRGAGKEKSAVVINGVARDRESLSAFVKKLESEEIFETVNLPVSNFAKDTNAEFSIDIKGSF